MNWASKKSRLNIRSSDRPSTSLRSLMHPHVLEACAALGSRDLEVNLLAEDPRPVLCRDNEPLRLALRGVRLKLSSILAAEGMTVDDLVHASLTFIRALHGNGSYVLLGKNNHSWKVLKTVTTWVS